MASRRDPRSRQRAPARQRFQEAVRRGGIRVRAPRAISPDRESVIDEFERRLCDPHPLEPVPCPPGLADAECDTLEALARWNLGLEGGRRYYTFVDTAPKNGMPYFYAVIAYDHLLLNGSPEAIGVRDTPISNFVYVEPHSPAQAAGEFDPEEIYVVPNPVTKARTAPWTLEPNNGDPSGEKLEFRNLPKCRSAVRIYHDRGGSRFRRSRTTGAAATARFRGTWYRGTGRASRAACISSASSRRTGDSGESWGSSSSYGDRYEHA